MKEITKEEKKYLSHLLNEKLSNLLIDQVIINYHSQITDEFFNEFSIIENFNFQKDLRYTKNELIEKISNPLSIFVDIRNNNKIVGIILGYEDKNDSNFFFLDTLIVTLQKRGIGTLLLDCLTLWIKYRKLKGIILYTEEFNYKRENLINFYLKNGFQKIDEIEGNITMRRVVS